MVTIQQGIEAFRAGRLVEARQIFVAVIQQDPNDERAWQWMYNVSNNDKERLDCLKQILRINPHNEKAKQFLAELTGSQAISLKPSVPDQTKSKIINNRAF